MKQPSPSSEPDLFADPPLKKREPNQCPMIYFRADCKYWKNGECTLEKKCPEWDEIY